MMGFYKQLKLENIYKAVLLTLSLGAFGVGCGGKKNTKKPPKKSADASGLTDKSCKNRSQCPKLNPRFSGVDKLSGYVGTTLSWNIQATTPEDTSRILHVSLHESNEKKDGMDVRTSDDKKSLLVKWKPEEVHSGSVKFRVRDITRCEIVTGDTSKCSDMNAYYEEYDIVSNEQYEIKAEENKEDEEDDKFTKETSCDPDQEGKEKYSDEYLILKGIQAGAEILNAALDPNKTIVEAGAEVVKDNVYEIADYAVNGNEVIKKTDEECYNENKSK